MNFLKKTLLILRSVDNKSFFKIQLLFIFLVLSLLLESLSVTLILPILAFFFSDGVTDLGILNFFFMLNDSLYHALFIFTLIIISKNIFNIFLGYYRTKFTFSTQVEISKRIFNNILIKNYNYFVSQGASIYLRNIFQEPNIFASGFLNPLLIIISELFVVLGVIIIISIIQPILFFFLISISGIILFIFFKIIKNKIRKLGKKRQEAEVKRLREVNNAFDSFQVTKIFNIEKYYLENLDSHSSQVVKAGVINETVANIPRFFLELLMIVLIVGIIIYSELILKLNNQETLIILTMYGYAAFRIFPSINRIMVNIQSVQFSIPTFELIYNLLKEDVKLENDKLSISNFSHSIKFENISFNYGEKKIFKNFNIEIPKNSIIGISGLSGSGKTTLLNLICGLMKFDNGEVYLDNQKLDQEKYNLMSLFSYVPQNNLLVDGSLIENIALGQDKNSINIRKINSILVRLNMSELVSNLSEGLNTNIGKNGSKLSGGQAQRVCIARALYFDRNIIIFDEPTSSLDTKNEEDFLNYIKDLKNSLTIIVVSHKESTLKFCDKIIQINNK